MTRIRFLRSTAFRIALGYVALFACSALVLVGFIYFTTADYMTRTTTQTIRADGEDLQAQYLKHGARDLVAAIKTRIENDDTNSSIYLLTNAKFEIQAGTLDLWPNGVGPQPAMYDVSLPANDASGPTHAAMIRHYILKGGAYHLLVGRDISGWQSIRVLILDALIGSLGVALLLAAGGGFAAQRVMLRRIDIINRTSERIMHGDLKRRVPSAGTGDEFDLLAQNLNTMLDQIEQLMDGIRHVSNAIAHDLRSPLARLRGRLDRALTEAGDVAGYRSETSKAIAEVDGLLGIFSALLRIAQAESGARREAFEIVEVDKLARGALDLYMPVAEEKGLTVESRLAPGLAALGDRHMLSQAMANLLDNAIKYTPPGGRISLTTQRTPAGLEIVVADSGAGIPAEARALVTERFYRLEASRTTAGSGLGLTLVAAVVKLHGGTLRFEDNRPGLRAILAFPPPTSVRAAE